MNARVVFVELPSPRLEQSKRFYESAFGWALADYGPTYSATSALGTDVGLQGDESETTAGPLAVIEVENLEEAYAAVVAAGAAIVREIFSFPGGRRFHFLDPSDNELAVMEPG